MQLYCVSYLMAAFCEGTHTYVEILTEHTWSFRATENSQRITNQHLKQEKGQWQKHLLKLIYECCFAKSFFFFFICMQI